jgi:hypothetical protein
MVLLISEDAYAPLQEPANVKRLVEFAHSENMDVQVVLIVREQLDLLNQAYCEQVMALETSDDFDTFVRQAIDSGTYDYAHAFQALLDADDVTVVAVPYSRLATNEPAQVLLREAGIDLPLPSARSPRPEPTVVGPVLVTATRLLHKRLTRLGRRVRSHRRVALSKAGNRLRAKARAHSWDDTPFWGWTPELTDVATQSFRDGNAAFAARTWNGDWPDAAPERSYTKPDLPARGAAVVVDVMDTIQAVIDKLPKHKKPSGRD